MAGGEKQKGANLCSPVIVIISLLLWLTRSDPHVAPGQRQSPRRGRFSLGPFQHVLDKFCNIMI